MREVIEVLTTAELDAHTLAWRTLLDRAELSSVARHQQLSSYRDNVTSVQALKMSGSYDDYLEALPKQPRREMHRKERKLGVEGASWKKALGTSVASKAEMRDFYATLMRRFG